METDFRTPYDHVEEAGYEDVLSEVRDILDGEDWVHLSVSSTPRTLAAGAVYFVHQANDHLDRETQQEVADAFDTTPISVRSGFKEIGQHYGLIDAE